MMKISKDLQRHLENHDRADVMIVLAANNNDIIEKYNNKDRALDPTQTQSMIDELMQHAAQSQQHIRQVLEKRPDDYERKPSYLWIVNQIGLTKASKQLIIDLSVLPEIQTIRLQIIATLN